MTTLFENCRRYIDFIGVAGGDSLDYRATSGRLGVSYTLYVSAAFGPRN